MNDATRQNDEWLEAAKEHFEQAVVEENWNLAQSIIEDVRSEGFADSATVLARELTAKQHEYGAR